MRYKWSHGKIDRIVLRSLILFFPLLSLSLYLYKFVCGCIRVCLFLLLLLPTLSFYVFCFFSSPKAEKWLRWFFDKTTQFFSWLTIFIERLRLWILTYICSMIDTHWIMPLYVILFHFAWRIFFFFLLFFFLEPKSINSLKNYFQMISFTVALDFISLAYSNSSFILLASCM